MPSFDKIAHHPNGKHIIQFRDRYHTYTDNFGVRYLSGTSLIKKFWPKFDAIEVSIKCSQGDNPLYSGRDPKEIREEWKAEGRRGSQEGDNTHAYAEYRFVGGVRPKPISERCKQLFKQVDKAIHWLIITKGFVFISAEMIVFSPVLKLAGMIDLVMWDPSKNQILILDWKQNKNPLTTENFYQDGLKPIDHLQQTETNNYTLQLSLYQFILDTECYFPNTNGYRRALIHLTPNSFNPIPLDFYSYEIDQIINSTGKE